MLALLAGPCYSLLMADNENVTLTHDDCLDSRDPSDPCKGEVDYRPAMSPTGKWFPRCEHHLDARLDTQAGIVSRYGGQMYYDSPSTWADEGEDY